MHLYIKIIECHQDDNNAIATDVDILHNEYLLYAQWQIEDDLMAVNRSNR